MKKQKSKKKDEMKAEYDFASMKGGVKGKYVERFKGKTNVVLLEPDVAKFFNNTVLVNEVLRTVMKLTKIKGVVEKHA